VFILNILFEHFIMFNVYRWRCMEGYQLMYNLIVKWDKLILPNHITFHIE